MKQHCEDPARCITCSDEGVTMRVLSCEANGALAWCERDNERVEVLTGLIENLQVGDVLIVHAGAALVRVHA